MDEVSEQLVLWELLDETMPRTPKVSNVKPSNPLQPLKFAPKPSNHGSSSSLRSGGMGWARQEAKPTPRPEEQSLQSSDSPSSLSRQVLREDPISESANVDKTDGWQKPINS